MAVREISLSQRQIEAASQLHFKLEQWRLSDEALLELANIQPGWNSEASILKCVAINSLYSTQVYAILRMAQHVTKIFKFSDVEVDNNLVEKIADLEGRKHVSFASKLCHFFVSDERFPIYDEAARDALRLHLGKHYERDNKAPYAAFRRNLSRLREKSGIGSLTGRMLDRYLWIVGMWLKYESLSKRRDDKSLPMNAELRRVFQSPNSEERVLLDIILPKRADL